MCGGNNELISGLKWSLYWGCIEADPKVNVWQQQWIWSAGWSEAYIEAASRLIQKSMCGSNSKLISGLKWGLYWGCIEADTKVNVWQQQWIWSAGWSEAYIEAALRLIRRSMCGSSSESDQRAEVKLILRLHRGWSKSQCVAAAVQLISGLMWGLYWGCIEDDPKVNVCQQQWSWSAGWSEAYIEAASRLIRKSMCGSNSELISGLKWGLYWGCIEADPKVNVWQQQWIWSAGWSKAYIEAASRLIRKSMCGSSSESDQRAEVKLILRLHRGWSEGQCVAAAVNLISGLKWSLYWGCIEADPKVNVWQQQWADQRAEVKLILRLHRGWSESHCVAAAVKLISGLKRGLYWGCIEADPKVNVWQQQWSWSADWSEAYIEAASRPIRKSMCGKAGILRQIRLDSV